MVNVECLNKLTYFFCPHTKFWQVCQPAKYIIIIPIQLKYFILSSEVNNYSATFIPILKFTYILYFAPPPPASAIENPSANLS